jgi:hypothetical protein
MEEKLYKTLKKVFDLIDDPWDDPEISEDLYNDIETVLSEYEKNSQKITNDITIDPNEILSMPDNSITDSETIRQIALYSIKYNTNSLNNKVKKEFQVYGLYPHIIKTYKIKPDDNRKSLFK